MTVVNDAATVPGDAADPFQGLPLLITVPRAAAILGVSRASAYRYADSGDLPIRRLGGRLYVITAGIRALVNLDDDRRRPHRGEVT